MLACRLIVLDNPGMTNHEHPFDSFDEIDQEFQRIVDNENIHDDQTYSIESINHVREHIVDSLIDHLVAYESIPADDIEDRTTAAAVITFLIQKDFERMNELDYGDEIIASGRSIILFAEPRDDDVEMRILPIDNNTKIKGKFGELLIQEIPLAQDIHRYINDDITESDEQTEQTTNQFGLVMHLVDVTTEDESGYSEAVPETLATFVPLNYPDLQLHRVIRQETV